MESELLSISVKGEGVPVIILHGLFGSSDNLARVAIELEKNYQVYRVDLRNHGDSFHHKEMDYPLMVEDLKKLMDYHGIARANLLGHSMGGKVAMAFALTYPSSVQKLIVADIAPVTYTPHHQTILKALNSVPLDTVTNRREADGYLAKYIDEPGVRQFLLKSLDFSNKLSPAWKFNLSAILENYASILSGNDSLQKFSGDTLFIAGGKSDYIKPEYKQKIMTLFPKAQLKIIPDASHWLHAEKPQLFISICQRFLEEK
jgi:esterase